MKDTYQKIRRNDYRIPSFISRDARALITRLLQSEPTSRPSPSDILSDPFITGGYLPAKLPQRCVCGWVVCVGVWESVCVYGWITGDTCQPSYHRGVCVGGLCAWVCGRVFVCMGGLLGITSNQATTEVCVCVWVGCVRGWVVCVCVFGWSPCVCGFGCGTTCPVEDNVRFVGTSGIAEHTHTHSELATRGTIAPTRRATGYLDFFIFFLLVPNLFTGPSSVMISTGRAGLQEGQGLSCAPPPCSQTPSLKGVGLEARARAIAKQLHHGPCMRLRGGSYHPPRDGNVCWDVPGWAEDQWGSHGKLLNEDYSGIIIVSGVSLLCLKICWHIRCRPSHDVVGLRSREPYKLRFQCRNLIGQTTYTLLALPW